jgi:hypothetical protein
MVTIAGNRNAEVRITCSMVVVPQIPQALVMSTLRRNSGSGGITWPANRTSSTL